MRKIRIPCTIKRGPFSGERIVGVNGGTFTYRGVAPVNSCQTSDGKSLTEDIPPKDKVITGAINVMLTSDPVTGQHLALPDGEVLEISPNELRDLGVDFSSFGE